MSVIKKSVSLLKVFSSVKACGLEKTSIAALPKTISCNKRYVSTIAPEANLKKQPLVTKEELLQFDEAFPSIVSNLTKNEKFGNITEIITRFVKSMNYNVPKGKKNRGLAVLTSYKIVEKPENLTPENIRLATILGWSVEMLQAFLLIADDVCDGSETRRGQLCWYKLEDVGLNAINDSLLIENVIYALLKEHFSRHPSYVHFLELFHDVTMRTVIGQLLDCNTSNIRVLTMERFKLIATYKTAYYSFYLPVCLGLYLANYTNPEVHRMSKEILLEIGTFFQIQDDILDCFGDPKVTGKIGTDIQTGKCTWLAATVMEIASAREKNIMKENYGKDNPENVKKIVDLYLQLNIPRLYREYEEDSYKTITVSIQNLPDPILRELFLKLIATIYKRNY